MDAKAIHARLAQVCGDAAGHVVEGRCEDHIEVEAEAIDSVCRVLRDQPDLAFEHLSNLTAVDYLDENRIGVIYHLHSYAHGRWLTLKVGVDRDRPHVPTVEAVYPVANWLER